MARDMKLLAAVVLLTACHSSNGGASRSDAAGAIAEDPARTIDERCADAFATFRTRVHPGDSAAAVRAILGSPTWIGSDEPVDVLGGEVPVQTNATDQVVAIMCLPKPDARIGNRLWSPWVIYARIEGRDHKTFGSFLSSDGAAKLVEYALVHIDTNGKPMKIEKFP